MQPTSFFSQARTLCCKSAGVLASFHTVPGITTILKCSISTIEAANKCGYKAFNGALPHLKPLKELHYGFEWIGLTAENFINGTTKQFQIPHYRVGKSDRGIDWVKVGSTGAAYCEFGRWLYKNNIYLFPRICALSAKYGYVKFFPVGRGKKISVEQMPYFKLLNHKLKDFILVPICGILVYRFYMLSSDKKREFDNYSNLAGAIGKGILILGSYYAPLKTPAGIAYTVVDLFTQYLGAGRKARTEWKKL